MKTVFTLLALSVSLHVSAKVESQNCPESFSISYYDITKSPLTSQIKNNPLLKQAWDAVKATQKLSQEFKISSRTSSALCVYTNGKAAVFLQTNNGVDELVVPFAQNLYFRTKVLSFANDYIELAIDEDSKKLLTPVYQIDSDGGSNVIDEVEVGTAEAVNVQVTE